MGKGTRGDGDAWLQKLISSALTIGISKRELLEEYYMDEIGEVIKAWNALHDPQGDSGETKMVDPLEFLGEGGERL